MTLFSVEVFRGVWCLVSEKVVDENHWYLNFVFSR
jgi:hypothetical protein